MRRDVADPVNGEPVTVTAASLAIGWAVSAWLDAALSSITIGGTR